MIRKGSQATPQYLTKMNKKYFWHFDVLKNEVIFEYSILSVLIFENEIENLTILRITNKRSCEKCKVVKM